MIDVDGYTAYCNICGKTFALAIQTPKRATIRD